MQRQSLLSYKIDHQITSALSLVVQSCTRPRISYTVTSLATTPLTGRKTFVRLLPFNCFEGIVASSSACPLDDYRTGTNGLHRYKSPRTVWCYPLDYTEVSVTFYDWRGCTLCAFFASVLASTSLVSGLSFEGSLFATVSGRVLASVLNNGFTGDWRRRAGIFKRISA